MSNYEKITTGMGEECGVFGAYDMDGGDVAPSVYYGLFALQHRGQESCGIAVTDTYGGRHLRGQGQLRLFRHGGDCPLFIAELHLRRTPDTKRSPNISK